MSATDDPPDEPTVPARSWTNPFTEGHPLHSLYGRRVRGEQDLVILIDDYHARRGTGKTVASLQLAEGMDQNGGLTWENVAMRVEEIRNAYYQLPERSGIVLDEGEVGASNRDAMTLTNRALREIMSMGRVEQKYVIVNTPAIGFIDKDVRKLADIWITMLQKGVGLVHFLERNPYANSGSGQQLLKKKALIHFEDIAKDHRLRDVYNRLTREKRKHIRGEEGSGYVPESEHEEELQKAREEVRQDTRDELIRDFYGHPEVDASQRILGDAAGLSQQHVGRIVRGD